MNEQKYSPELLSSIQAFDRNFFEGKEDFTCIGKGALGGKASGLAFIKNILSSKLDHSKFKGITVNIPRLTVIATNNFDNFMKQNNLYDVAYSDESDRFIAYQFQKASIPAELLGDLRALIAKVHTPLAIRSSSLLEDAMNEPFAGIYGTKMIPNNQFDTDTRFQKLAEAVKFIYASMYFKEAKDYIKATNKSIEEEKMAVIIQEVVGLRYGDRFYPDVSGVGRSYNFYPIGRSKPEDGVVNLALGLGKTIVDGGISWTYSPAFPRIQPPFVSVDSMIENTQREFWAVNMGKPPAYDPIKETEYMFELNIEVAEQDEVLANLASTYDSSADRLVAGVNIKGPRVINFYPLLTLKTLPINNLIQNLLDICSNALGTAVEIEFAMTIDKHNPQIARFGFLQVRPMVVSNEEIEISEDEMTISNVLLKSNTVMGNGIIDNLYNIVIVKPDKFNLKYSNQIASELEEINREIISRNERYLLIGYGRWGSSDPWLGIPVNWGQISGAKVIIEAMLPNVNVDLSQGSHFFHNITSFRVLYFSLKASEVSGIDWQWLNSRIVILDKEFVKWVKLDSPLKIKADGRSSRGVIMK